MAAVLLNHSALYILTLKFRSKFWRNSYLELVQICYYEYFFTHTILSSANAIGPMGLIEKQVYLINTCLTAHKVWIQLMSFQLRKDANYTQF